jgi:hypothetical protein
MCDFRERNETMKREYGWDGRTWIYARLGHDRRSWRLVGERMPDGHAVWVAGGEAVGRLYEVCGREGLLGGLPGPRSGLSVVYALAARGTMEVVGWERVARVRGAT